MWRDHPRHALQESNCARGAQTAAAGDLGANYTPCDGRTALTRRRLCHADPPAVSAAAVALALALDALVGDPPGLWRRVGHPVSWFGAAVSWADRALNRGDRRVVKGALGLIVVLALFSVPAAAVAGLLGGLPAGVLGVALLAFPLLAHRSLHEHVRRVADAPDLTAARTEVAMIVGRDTAELDEAGVSRAALETLSESLSDGVVAPAFWLFVGGLPGIVAYKIVNTADSMIGHRTPRYEAFGKAAARLDDLMNLIPARLTAVLVLALSAEARGQARTVVADARAHVSPNAGWPEAAFAAALGVSLGGPRRYAGRLLDGHWLQEGAPAPDRATIVRGLALSRRVGYAHGALYALLAVAPAA